MQVALTLAKRGSCVRRAVGCVLLNKEGHIIGTGYNGKHSGAVECYESPCKGAFAESGKDLENCEAIHAEINALLQCCDVHSIEEAYVTTAPCNDCTKALLNTSCKTIYFLQDYPTSGAERWIKSGREWIRITLEDS